MSVDDISTILADFRAKRWTADPFTRFLRLRRENPAAAAQLVMRAFDELPESATVVDAALSDVSEAEFDDLITLALARLAKGRGADVAESVVAYASLQYPHLLHPHLAEIFEVAPNAGTYYETWPWRDAGDEALEFLTPVVQSRSTDAFKAWSCMLEMRTMRSLQRAASLATAVPLRYAVKTYLEEVGYDSPERPLFGQPVMHVIFPQDYFDLSRPPWNQPGKHPSWHAWSEVATSRFGGYADSECGLCRQPVHHLLTIPATASPLRRELSIVTCFSCLGWEKSILYYDHAESPPKSLDSSEPARTPEFPATPLKETLVTISLTAPRWRWQDWALSNSRENLNRILGHPCWIQSAEYPACAKCGVTMRFLMQCDSNLPTTDGEWLWGSGGIGYVFLCSSCEVTAVLWQCT